MKARIGVSSAAAALLLTASIVVFGATPGAVAVQGQSLIAGDPNTETSPTLVRNTASTITADDCIPYTDSALVGCGQTGLAGRASQTGVFASGGVYGVDARGKTAVLAVGDASSGSVGVSASGSANGVYAAANGTGVFGYGTTGVSGQGSTGVYGKGTENGVQADGGTFGVFATGTEYGVYARGTAHGVYGEATAVGGAGVDAAGSSGALALRVTGKATFSRSGVVTVGAGTAAKTVTLSGVSASSMILATAQQSSSVSVKAAVPAVPSNGSFRILLTGNAPAGGLKVAYFVLN